MDFYLVEIILNGGGKMTNKILIFLRKNGFLLFLFISVCVVAVGTIFIATKDLRVADKNKLDDLVILSDNTLREKENAGDKEVSLDTSMEETKAEELKDTVVETVDEVMVEVQEKEISKDVEIASEDTVKDNTEELEFVEEEEEEEEKPSITIVKNIESVLPVQGAVITEHSLDSLVYSKTLDEWRGHPGIDIKAEEGTKVVSPLDGTIKNIYEDDLWGIVIVIDHGQGLETKFANLGTKEMVKVGTKVNKGDYISTIGKTASIEMMIEPHLHFEATINGKMIDPRSINN